MSDGPGDDGEDEDTISITEESYADIVAARLDGIGVLLTRVEALTDPELRKLGVQAVEKGIRSIPTGRSAKLLSVVK